VTDYVIIPQIPFSLMLVVHRRPFRLFRKVESLVLIIIILQLGSFQLTRALTHRYQSLCETQVSNNIILLNSKVSWILSRCIQKIYLVSSMKD